MSVWFMTACLEVLLVKFHKTSYGSIAFKINYRNNSLYVLESTKSESIFTAYIFHGS